MSKDQKIVLKDDPDAFTERVRKMHRQADDSLTRAERFGRGRPRGFSITPKGIRALIFWRSNGDLDE